MKRTHIGIVFLLLAGTPAMAALDTGNPDRDQHSRRTSASYERLLEGMSSHEPSREEASSLPLECRGYYLQEKSRRGSSALSRCE